MSDSCLTFFSNAQIPNYVKPKYIPKRMYTEVSFQCFQHIWLNIFVVEFLVVFLNNLITFYCLRREQDNSPQDNCPPQIFFSFIFSFWLPLSDYELHCTTILSLQNTLLFKPVLRLYLACNHYFSKFFLIINLCT